MPEPITALRASGPSPRQVPAPHGDDPRAPASQGQVLVVDDNADAAEMLATLLQLYGYEVTVAHDGAAALARAAALAPRIVLLDLGLPDIDGLEVCRRLRADAATRAARIVALTGWGQDADRRQTADAGFDGHLVKPVDPDALIAAIGGR